jgi:hypothetical protein
VSQRFSYIKYDQQSQDQQQALKLKFEEVEALVEKIHDGRAKALILTHLEIAYMWTGKAIRDAQIDRNAGDAQEQPERSAE